MLEKYGVIFSQNIASLTEGTKHFKENLALNHPLNFMTKNQHWFWERKERVQTIV
jgi:hypothetical protein